MNDKKRTPSRRAPRPQTAKRTSKRASQRPTRSPARRTETQGHTSEDYSREILQYLLTHNPGMVKPRALARQMRIDEEDYATFRSAYKQLRDAGRILRGTGKALTLPAGDTTILGRFHLNERGFGFVTPNEPTSNSDLFIPAGRTAGAVTGDLVVARILTDDSAEPRPRQSGEIIEIQQRGNTRIVGTLQKTPSAWVVIPDGRTFFSPVLIRDVSPDRFRPGAKVQADIIWYPPAGEKSLPEGIIAAHWGQSGEPAAEIQAVMAAHGLEAEFSPEADREARERAAAFDPDDAPGREDWTSLTICTIDPDTARDYDDAISLDPLPKGGVRLGVHIADVSHFVVPGTPLDETAYARGSSVYFPRFVVPMLPAVLSNGVCSLQAGVRRFALSAFIDYDKSGHVMSTRFCESVIRSTARLTYAEAQGIIDGGHAHSDPKINDLVRRMHTLAQHIEARRNAAGMLHLDLPEIELILDDDGRVTGAQPVANEYTHKIIEMFMVEANEAAAARFRRLEIPLIRRIHPRPDSDAMRQLSLFVKACGHTLSESPTLHDLQRLIAEVADTPESYAVNLAVLRAFQRATYSIDEEGHFALASADYCHFTSPIRRYPDLMVHRATKALLRQTLRPGSDDIDTEALQRDADFLSTRERIAQAAEVELRLVLVLLHLAEKKGETFRGVITGVADFGIFVQTPQFLIEGLIRLSALGDDWWEVMPTEGRVRGDISGRVFRIGDTLEVRIDGVDLPRRQLLLSLADAPPKTAPAKKTAQGDDKPTRGDNKPTRGKRTAPKSRAVPRKKALPGRRTKRKP
ncbi:MAG: VacB/RNase II family 3'-5' exoribonuclease [Proteobacteria bacterium]|nr:VacB/RNase II family 3'-5' exoribonuclease [Pseudomonadota bacterium]